MIKTITLTDVNGEPKDLVLSNRVGWFVEYRDQFGRDIVPAIMPLIMSVTSLIRGLAEDGVDFNKVELDDVAKILESEAVIDAAIKLSMFEFTDFLNVVWALNKAADETVPEPKTWIRQFDEFPLDEIGPVMAELVVKGVLSSKNWARLTEAWTKLKPAEKKTKKTSR